MEPIKLYLGVKAVIIQDGKLLVLKRLDGHNKEFWDMPGGRMSAGEDVMQTLKRELQEELPSLIDYTVGELLKVYKKPMRLSDGTELCILYYAVTAPTFDVVLSDEHFEYEWMTPHQVSQLPEGFSDVYGDFFK